MDKKTVTCKRCGESNLRWTQSKKGNWYLTPVDGAQVRGDSGKVIKVLQLAHRCPTAEQIAERKIEDHKWELLAQKEQITSRKNELLHMFRNELAINPDSDRTRELFEQAQTLETQIKAIELEVYGR